MIIETSQILGLPVVNSNDQELGTVDSLIFNGPKIQVSGLQIVRNGVIKKFYGLMYPDVVKVSRSHLVVESEKVLLKNLRDLDELYKLYGRVIGVAATTESGKKIGHVTDLIIEAETGLIIRFVIRHLLYERIIPRQFLVSITPRAIVFQDVVDQPTFDRLAAHDLAPEPRPLHD